MQIHQLLSGFMPGDAISNYARELQNFIRSWGCSSEIFVTPNAIDPRMGALCRPVADHARFSRGGNVLIYHFSIGSPASDYFSSVPDAKIIIYHNITPAHYFALIKPDLAAILAQGREELAVMAKAADLALGVSEYNRRELLAAGYPRTGVIPLTLNWRSLEGNPSRSLRLRYHGDRDNLLFVGRIVPNKKIEDLIKTFYYFKLIKPEAKLFIVGKHQGMEIYLDYLKSIVRELELPDVIFAGHTTQSQWLAYYRLGRVYLCLSEHEGFCLPLLEAMYFNLPVLAFAAAAVPDTLDGSGILIREKQFPEIAEMAALLCDDPKLRQSILAGQQRRLEQFKSLPVGDILREHLRPWLR